MTAPTDLRLGWASASTLGCFAITIVGAPSCSSSSKRVTAPLVDLRLLRNQILVGATLAILIVPMYMFSGKELAPNEDQGVVFGAIDVPPNATLEQLLPGQSDGLDTICSGILSRRPFVLRPAPMESPQLVTS